MAKSSKRHEHAQEAPSVQNFVHKHMETFNKPKTFEDRKKAAKSGKVKHKGRWDASF